MTNDDESTEFMHLRGADPKIRARMQRWYFAEDLRERKLYDFNEKFRLPTILPEVKEANPEVFAVAERFPLEENLWIHGQHGLGKSHTCRAVANRYVFNLKSAAAISGPEIRDIGEEFGQKRSVLIEPYCEVEFLLVDDLDKALKWTENSLETLWRITDGREQKGLRTIITSQKTPQDFFKNIERMIPGSAEFSVSILDRLKPLSIFEFKGQPRRGQ